MRGERSRIDWKEVRARLRSAESALERSVSADAGRVEKILRDRASRLSARRSGEETGTAVEEVPVLVFNLGTERYALPLSVLVEAAPLGAWTPLPGAPAELLGVINHRGEIRAVGDLGRILGLPSQTGEGAGPGRLLLMYADGDQLGLRVDGVEEVRLVHLDERSTSSDEPPLGSPFVAGIAPDGVIFLNAAAILSIPLFKESSHS